MTHTLYFCGAPVSGPIMWCNTFFFYMYTKPSQTENSHVTGLSIRAGSQPKPPAS